MEPPSPRENDATRTMPLDGNLQGQESEEGNWVTQLRSHLSGPGRFLLYREDHHPVTYQLTQETTRIGRSLQSDLRFEDSTVSRRHAIIMVAETVRLVDDRSLNGVLVNGQRVDACALNDGDEVKIGRHSLFYVEIGQ